MQLSDFDFTLPRENIALHPMRPRDKAKLLHVAGTGLLSDFQIGDLPQLLSPGDLLIANDTAVIHAQLSARRGAASIGLTLDRPLGDGTWDRLMPLRVERTAEHG